MFSLLTELNGVSWCISEEIVKKKGFVCLLSIVNYSRRCEEWLSGLFQLVSSRDRLSSDASPWVYCFLVYPSWDTCCHSLPQELDSLIRCLEKYYRRILYVTAPVKPRNKLKIALQNNKQKRSLHRLLKRLQVNEKSNKIIRHPPEV